VPVARGRWTAQAVERGPQLPIPFLDEADQRQVPVVTPGGGVSRITDDFGQDPPAETFPRDWLQLAEEFPIDFADATLHRCALM
jgi:hypothetical protein